MPDFQLIRWRGRYCAMWYDEERRRHRRSLGTSHREEAVAALHEFRRIYELSQAAGDLRVGKLYRDYLLDREVEQKPAAARIRDAWKRLEACFGNLLPQHVTKEICRQYVLERQAAGASDGTIHLELGYLRAALGFAKRQGRLPEVPYVPLPRKPAPRNHFLTKDEVRSLLASCATPHLRLFVTLAVATGARAGALLDLTWDRVDLDRKRIVLQDPGRPETSKGRATVPINNMALEALHEAHRGALTPYVIEWGGHKVSSVKKGIAGASRRAGVNCSPHVLRHTAAVWMAEAGVPMEEIGQFLGHSDVATTRRVYARYSPDFLQRAAGALEL